MNKQANFMLDPNNSKVGWLREELEVGGFIFTSPYC